MTSHDRAAERLPEPTRLGLPEGIRACLFDPDGVLTQTAKVHAAAGRHSGPGAQAGELLQ